MTFTTNAAGQVRSATDSAGTVGFEYDNGDLSAVVDAVGHTTRILTDSAGRPLTQTDPLGHVTRFDHTLFNQVRQVVDAQQAATTLTYDPNGNLRTLTDARNHVTESPATPIGRSRLATAERSASSSRPGTHPASG